MPKSNRSRSAGKSAKPAKPYPDFPLTPHNSGRWCKKIRGKLHFFGRWGNVREGKVVPVDDVAASADAAVELYKEQRDDLYAGRKPRPKEGEGIRLRDVVNRYLTRKRQLLDAGEITARTFGEYHATCGRLVDAFGADRLVSTLASDDFGKLRAVLAKTRGPVALGNEITRVKMVFKFGFDEWLIEQPRYGQSFKKPSTKVLRKARHASGKRMFEADELRTILAALDGKPVSIEGKDEPLTLTAAPVMRAMVLLAANCGFGQWDIASLPIGALDLDDGWATFPRPKTGIERRSKLWPETAAAVRAALALRKAPRDQADADIAFLTAKGKRWVRASEGDDPSRWAFRTDLIGHEFAKLLKRLGINGRRGFYAIRHSFQTAAEDSRDLPAVRHVMGHADASMSGVYRERISDDRLQAVADAVRSWLWPEASETEGGAA